MRITYGGFGVALFSQAHYHWLTRKMLLESKRKLLIFGFDFWSFSKNESSQRFFGHDSRHGLFPHKIHAQNPRGIKKESISSRARPAPRFEFGPRPAPATTFTAATSTSDLGIGDLPDEGWRWRAVRAVVRAGAPEKLNLKSIDDVILAVILEFCSCCCLCVCGYGNLIL